MGQGAALPVKRVPVIMHQAGKGHSDVASRRRPNLMETQGGGVAPGFEGTGQDVVHQVKGQGA